MAEASPICRGKNLTVETVLAFINAMPLNSMEKNAFHSACESKLKGWTQTHSQIARQLALYYEEAGICYPRFSHKVTYSEVVEYVVNWAMLYCVPNPYTPSLVSEGSEITNIYAFVKEKVRKGQTSFDGICTEIFGIELNNTDKVRVYLNNFTDLIISDDVVTINKNLVDLPLPIIHPNVKFDNGKEFFCYFTNEKKERKKYVADYNSLPLQQIIYGAPGTGKSHTIKERTVGREVIRTTFHPDSDYSTFVGTYKPTTKSIPVTTVIGTKAVAVEDEEGNKISEDKIVYEFVPQAFLQAYVSAWQKYANMKEGEQPEEEVLVIEEINRGNCAQIFGDLFQLLDRGDSGFSEYPIKADADMKKFLQKAFANISLDGVKGVLAAVYDDTDIASQVLAGDILLLPNNLYIWATMNTSDQSLFPIDSAFKRRWDWQYVPINNAGLNYVIEVNGNRYDWWHFLEEINQRIYKVTYSEDKKLGYFFCKARNGVIDTDTFVSKVVFYLWNDVFKDMEFEGDAFRDGENGKLTFDKFYTVEGNKTKVVSEKVEVFLKNLGLEALDNKE